MSKVKILHVITRMDKGGSAQIVRLLTEGLDAARYEVSLASGRVRAGHEDIIESFAAAHIRYYCVPALVRQIDIFKDIAAFLHLYRLIKAGDFDIVHTHTSKAGFLGRWAAKFAKVKRIVHTPHGHIFYGYFGKAASRLFVVLERITGRITDRIITLTRKGKEDHVHFRIAAADKFVPIYSGIDVKFFSEFPLDQKGNKEALGIASDILVIGTVTRLDPIKGNGYLLEALSQVLQECAAVMLVIIGDGPQHGVLEGYARRMGIREKVIFTGAVEDIRPLVSAFDIFVLPSLNEGMGRCLLEAQALGKPVVATRVGGVPEVVKDGVTGILVPPRDSRALAAAVLRLLTDGDLRRQFARAAKGMIDERFDVKEMVRQTARVYEELLLSKR